MNSSDFADCDYWTNNIGPHPIQRPLVDADPGHGDVCVSDGDLEGHVRGEDSPVMVTRHLV